MPRIVKDASGKFIIDEPDAIHYIAVRSNKTYEIVPTLTEAEKYLEGWNGKIYAITEYEHVGSDGVEVLPQSSLIKEVGGN
jgi:hypothetical protein